MVFFALDEMGLLGTYIEKGQKIFLGLISWPCLFLLLCCCTSLIIIFLFLILHLSSSSSSIFEFFDLLDSGK